MSPVLLAAALWVFAATATAFLPYRLQMAPGLALIAGAVAIIALIFVQHGWLLGCVALAAFVSFFRRPLAHLSRWLLRKART